MGERSQIEWTDATWNPTTGCTRVSAGCDHCYAHTLANGRLAEVYLRKLPVIRTEENLADPFAIRVWRERFYQPERWTDPKMIFVNSMSDLFHVDIPEDDLRSIFEVMLRVDRHIYQVLTKRPSRAVRFFRRNGDLFPDGEIPAHVWIGTSVENQDVIHRVEHLRQLPAAIRFLSCEPLLDAARLRCLLLTPLSLTCIPGHHRVLYRGDPEVTVDDLCDGLRPPKKNAKESG